MTEQPPPASRKAALAQTASGVLALAASALVGGYLISNGWVFVGGLGVFLGFLAAGSKLRPAKFAEGFVSVFWVAWTGFGLFALLKDARVFSAVPVAMLFAVGVFRLRSLFRKKAAVDALPASERVVEGELGLPKQGRPVRGDRD